MTDPPDPTATLKTLCPSCGATRESGATFCEVCGLDFATGKLPAAPPPPPAASAEAPSWSIVISVDEEFFARNQPEDASVSLPTARGDKEIPLRGDEVLIGRRSDRGGVHPDVDLSIDSGVSRRHAVLKRTSAGWVIVDQGSTNGTEVDGRSIDAGTDVAIDESSIVHLGAFTRLTLKRAD